jgi:hypothetical protein
VLRTLDRSARELHTISGNLDVRSVFYQGKAARWSNWHVGARVEQSLNARGRTMGKYGEVFVVTAKKNTRLLALEQAKRRALCVS